MRLVPLLTICTGFAASPFLRADVLPFNQMIIFGDSVSDNGNVYIALGGAPPAPAPPLYTVGRFTNGPDVTPGTEHFRVCGTSNLRPSSACRSLSRFWLVELISLLAAPKLDLGFPRWAPPTSASRYRPFSRFLPARLQTLFMYF